MTEITLAGNPVNTAAELPAVGSSAPDFELVGLDLEPVRLKDFSGQRVVLNIFPSIDTGTCAMSVRTFNQRAAELENTTVVCISADLPFAQKRFCGAEGIENVVMGSAFRSSFGTDYGVEMINGPLQGLTSRAVVVIDPEGTVVYTQQVAVVSDEPDYDSALEALNA